MKSDAQLIKEACERAEPLGELYQRYVVAISRWFHAHAPEREASELTAETFAQVALSLRRFEDRAGGSAGALDLRHSP